MVKETGVALLLLGQSQLGEVVLQRKFKVYVTFHLEKFVFQTFEKKLSGDNTRKFTYLVKSVSYISKFDRFYSFCTQR